MSKTASAPALLALVVLAGAFVPARPLAAAAPSKAKVHGIALSGRVWKVDSPSKTLVVRDGSGREVVLAWTAATKITGGDLKPGEFVTLRYLDKDKKHIATTIHLGPVAPTNAPAPATASPSTATSPKPPATTSSPGAPAPTPAKR